MTPAFIGSLAAPSSRTQRWSLAGLQIGIALMAIVSLHPYFLWSHQKPAYAVATLVVIASCAGCWRSLSFTRERIVLAVAFSLFLIYLSLLPKVHGGTTRWFFLIPFTVALLHLRREDLQGAFEKFHWLFAASLLPGMLVWLWLAAGLPLELEWTYPPSEIVQRGPTPYFMGPGMVFLPTNGMLLPNGGTIFRLCGVYDEPGTVGTIAALCLAATRYRLGNVKGAISFAAGIMSMSIAFAILTAIGLMATAMASRRYRLFALALVGALGGLVSIAGLEFKIDDPQRWTSITTRSTPNPDPGADTSAPARMPTPSQPERKADKSIPPSGPFGLWDAQIRQTQALDNRALPAMRTLFAEYVRSGPGILLFGMASNASNVRAGDSSSWLQIPINYGIVGFAGLFVLFAAPIAWLWHKRNLDSAAALFCLLFLMSFYQRPVIWLPAQLLMYLAGLLRRDRR